MLGNWGADLPPERIHVVTVPQPGARRTATDLLWLRFCEAFGIDPAWAPADSERANPSLGIAETQLIRQLNRRLGRETRREAAYDALIREMLAEDDAGRRRRRRPVRLPPDGVRLGRGARPSAWIDYLRQSGRRRRRRPRRPAPGAGRRRRARWHDPDRVRPRKRLQVAVDALAAMTEEAASRPDPDQQLVRRMRANAERLRGR